MKRLSLFIVICAVLFSTNAFAVSEAAVLSLLISPSPQANAMGQSYGALWSDDPMAGAVNPAAVGLYAQQHNFGFSFFPEKVGWLPTFADDLWLDYKALTLGFNLNSITNLPFSIGISSFHSTLNFGSQIYTDETGIIIGSFESYEKYSNTTISAAVDYFLHASFGYAFKNIDSKLGARMTFGEGRAQPKAHDWGLIVQAPIFGIMQKLKKPVSLMPTITPFLTPGFSYSKRNIGDSVIYIDVAQADPLPREVYIGVNFEAGLSFTDKNWRYDLFHFRWAREVEDLLIERLNFGGWIYKSGLHDIKFWDNVILGEDNELAIKHQGWQISFGDVYFMRRGCYEDIEGRVVFDANGYGVNFVQPFRILASVMNYDQKNIILNILLNLDIEYHYSSYEAEKGHPLSDTEFKGMTIGFRHWRF